MPKKLTQKQFIKKAKTTHYNEYDYSLVEYMNSHTKIKIICKTHGIFKQMPYMHTNQSQGCPKCFGTPKYTLEQFIKKAKTTHYNEYDYSLVEYVNSYTKIKIICKIHGEFTQVPVAHLIGKGCKKCGIVRTAESHKYNVNKFIEKAKNIHGDKYDYSKFVYDGSSIKGLVICTYCDREFLQKPTAHLTGYGCPNCTISKGEEKIKQFLKKNRIDFEHQKKFDNCKNKRRLVFDFYISKQNILIEYDGKQHFGIGGFGSKNPDKIFKDIKINDTIKTKYAIDNNIKLIRFNYTQFDKLEEVLYTELGVNLRQ